VYARRAWSSAVPRPFSDDQSMLTPELWDPATKSFTRLAAMAVPRVYHSFSILLTDGRVLTGGGGLCSCPTDHPNVQVLTPPYLFNLDGSPAVRPQITSAPATAAMSGTLNVTTNGPVSSFALVRMSSVTHSVNNEQRRVPLSFTTVSATNYQVNLSAASIVVPGYWMLFALNANGVPSKAAVVRIN